MPQDPAGSTVDLSSLPRHITLAVGERSVIPLPSYANSGNSWSATCLRGQGVARVSVELGAPPPAAAPRGDGTAEPPPLRLTPEQAVVSGLVGGEAVWQLVLSRTFGPSPVAAAHDLRITVLAVPGHSR